MVQETTELVPARDGLAVLVRALADLGRIEAGAPMRLQKAMLDVAPAMSAVAKGIHRGGLTPAQMAEVQRRARLVEAEVPA